jgi:branched-chain amino acid transport system permease protein
VVGSVIGASLLVYLMEILREFKSTQEIVFGCLLVCFMIFQPHGLVVFMKRWLPGWEEPLHLLGPLAPDASTRSGAHKGAAPAERPAMERA